MIYQPKTRIENILTLAGSLIIAVALLVYMLPRETKFGYEYEQGRPWRYNSLIATFDFPIYKTHAEVEAEKDSALRYFQPFYVEDAQVSTQQIQAFRQDFHTGRFGTLSPRLRDHIEHQLLDVYRAGIVSSAELSQMAKDLTTGIKIVEGTEAMSRPLGELYSTRSAYEHVMAADTVNFPREVLARCNINKYLTANLHQDPVKTKAAMEDVIASVSPASGMVQSGQRIIDRGEIVSPDQYKILQSFEKETVRRNDPSQNLWRITLGQVLFVLCILLSLVYYLKLFRRDYLSSPHTVLLISTLVTVFPLITYMMVGRTGQGVYMIPYAMVPIFIRVFMDSRTAFMVMVCTLVLSSLALHGNYEFLLVQLMAGMTAIYSLRELSERSQLLKVALVVVVATSVIMFSYELAQGIDWFHIDHRLYIYLAINGVLLLFAYPMLYLIEKLFGFTSGVTLVELSNSNHSILRRMSKVAQGTFVHSMQVANLAAEVADKIGAKPQLVRTGALYHDIGKMLNPAFFTENQTGVNPHDDLPEERSAQIIISHVTEGLRLAEKNHLPKVIKDFILTHHGRSMTKYFYIQWKNKHPEQEPDPQLFTYPGPNPFTREQAILMMCDAVEASSRSLKEYSEESIQALVNKIIDGQVSEGYFKECPITFRDISDAKRVLVESLKTVYHTRIAYPELNAAKADEEPSGRTYFFGRNSKRT